MLKSKFIQYILLCFIGVFSANAQLKTSVLLQSTDEDERIEISVDKSVYFPGDTVLLIIQRKDSTTTASVTPILPIEGTTLKSIGRRTYLAVIPQSVPPGLYPCLLYTSDAADE